MHLLLLAVDHPAGLMFGLRRKKDADRAKFVASKPRYPSTSASSARGACHVAGSETKVGQEDL